MAGENVTAVVLAAGKGTRMKSRHAKVLHEIFFSPMIHHVLDALAPLGLAQTVVVTGHQRERVEAALAGYPVSFAEQKEQLGTGHAVLAARREINGAGGPVLILCGDTPLVRSETLAALVNTHLESGAVLSLMTTHLDDPTNYGRIVTDDEDRILGIVEEKDASEAARQIREINAGIYCVESAFLLDALGRVGTDNKQGEVYLTDIVGIARSEGHEVRRFLCADADEVLGVNSRVELALAHASLQDRRNRQLMADGVTLLNPATIAVEKTVAIGADTVVYPNVQIGGESVIGSDCVIGPGTVIRDCRLGNGVVVGPLAYLEGAEFADQQIVPPHSGRTGPG